MSPEHPEDEVLTLDEVFEEDDTVSLAVTAAEWSVLMTLLELGGVGSSRAVNEVLKRDAKDVNAAVKSLLDRGVLQKGGPGEAADKREEEHEESMRRAARFLDGLREKNCYQVLGISPDAEDRAVRSAYYGLMREYHPDRFMSETDPEARETLKEIFRTMTKAYETLSDPRARREYDLTIPDYTGVLDKEEEEAFEALLADEMSDVDVTPERNPDMAKSFYESALADFQAENYESAELNFKLALALDPGNEDYKSGHEKTKRIADSLRADLEAEKAAVQEEMGEYKWAIRHLGKATMLKPENAENHYNLARLLEARGKSMHTARMHILLAIDRRPGKVTYLLLFGRIQEKLDELVDARRTYRKVVSLDRDNEEAKERLEAIEKKLAEEQ